MALECLTALEAQTHHRFVFALRYGFLEFIGHTPTYRLVHNIASAIALPARPLFGGDLRRSGETAIARKTTNLSIPNHATKARHDVTRSIRPVEPGKGKTMEPRETPPDREPAIRMIAMPADANPSGDIFGGYIMSLMGSI